MPGLTCGVGVPGSARALAVSELANKKVSKNVNINNSPAVLREGPVKE